MPPYTPPPQFDTEIRTTVFRPDGRNHVETRAEFLAPGYGIELGRTEYANPDASNTQLRVTLLLDERSQSSVTAGLSLSDGAVVPEFSATTVLLDNENQRLRVYFDRGLITSDSRAVEALIQQNVVGLEFDTGDLNTRYQLSLNSDDVEIHEGWLSVPINGNEFLRVQVAMRAASAESDFVWSPKLWSNFGVLVGWPVVRGDNLNVQLGVQPGLSVTAARDESGIEINPTIPFGARAQYTPAENFRINAGVAVGYGVTANLGLRFTF